MRVYYFCIFLLVSRNCFVRHKLMHEPNFLSSGFFSSDWLFKNNFRPNFKRSTLSPPTKVFIKPMSGIKLAEMCPIKIRKKIPRMDEHIFSDHSHS